MKNRHSILDSFIHCSELSSQPLPSIPLVEVMGFSRVLIENHKCILSYSLNSIDIQVKHGLITVQGEELHLAHLSQEQLIITGVIHKILLNGGMNG